MAQLSQPKFLFGDYSHYPVERRLLCRGESVALTPKVFDTLLLLVTKAGHLVEKEAFLKEIWPDAFVEESSLAQNISVLRKALGGDGNGNKFIQTVPKRGYRFKAKVKVLAEEGASDGGGGANMPSQALPADLTRTLQAPVEVARQQTNRSQFIGGFHSLAVLPFTNGSGPPEAEYLSEGISESIINLLSQFPDLRVIPRTSALSLQGS